MGKKKAEISTAFSTRRTCVRFVIFLSILSQDGKHDQRKPIAKFSPRLPCCSEIDSTSFFF